LHGPGTDRDPARGAAVADANPTGRRRSASAVGRRPAVVEHQEIARARQALGDDVRVVLPDDLANRLRRRRLAIVGTHPPDDAAVAADNRYETRLAAADEDVIRTEPLIAVVVPVVRADVRRGVDVEPVDALALTAQGGRRFH